MQTGGISSPRNLMEIGKGVETSPASLDKRPFTHPPAYTRALASLVNIAHNPEIT
jgi:hypothetical protein